MWNQISLALTGRSNASFSSVFTTFQLAKSAYCDFCRLRGSCRVDPWLRVVVVALRVRDLKTNLIGHLVAFSGTVTRASEVRPELLYGVFKCTLCGSMSGKIEQQFKYTEPAYCTQRTCPNRTKWQLDVSSSQFVDWQRVRVQEHSDEIPPGSMPRSVDVILRHAAVEKAKAGDKCTFTGSLIVVPDVSQLFKAGQAPRSYQGGAGEKESEGFTGLKALGVRDLTYRTAFLAR
jgi:DNA replication licensing factor MCM6